MAEKKGRKVFSRGMWALSATIDRIRADLVVTDHATPVGSGTVARTKRILVEQRAEAAVIAWMWHRTTGYDGMAIPRIKGKRREVRRMLARRSQELLERYRRGESAPDGCPLKKALASGLSVQAEL